MKQPIIARFIRGSSYTVVSGFISLIIGFYGVAISVRYIPKEDFGIFVLLYVIANFFMMLFDFGMQNTITKFIAAENREKNEIIATVLGFRLLVGGIGIIVIILIKKPLNALFEFGQLSDFIFAISVLFAFQYVFEALREFLQGLHFYEKIAILDLTNSIIRVSLIIILMIYFEMGLLGLIIATLTGIAITCILAYIFLPQWIVPKIDYCIIKRMLRFGFPLQINKLLAFVFERTDTIMLGAMLSSISVAIYEVGYKLPTKFRVIFNSFRQVYFAQISEFYGQKNNIQVEKLLKNTLRLVGFSGASVTIVFILFSEEIIRLLFSQKYLDSSPILIILMVGMSIGLCNHLIGNALIASGNPKAIILPSVTESVLNITGNVILIPLFGIIGAASASLISRVLINPILLAILAGKQSFSISLSYIRSFIPLAICTGLYYYLNYESLSFKFVVLIIFFLTSMGMKAISLNDFTNYFGVWQFKKLL